MAFSASSFSQIAKPLGLTRWGSLNRSTLTAEKVNYSLPSRTNKAKGGRSQGVCASMGEMWSNMDEVPTFTCQTSPRPFTTSTMNGRFTVSPPGLITKLVKGGVKPEVDGPWLVGFLDIVYPHAPDLNFAIIKLDPHQVVPAHVHSFHVLYIMLAGEVEVKIVDSGQSFTAKAGNVYFIPENTKYSIEAGPEGNDGVNIYNGCPTVTVNLGPWQGPERPKPPPQGPERPKPSSQGPSTSGGKKQPKPSDKRPDPRD